MVRATGYVFRERGGFTLLEMIIYLGVLMLSLVVVIVAISGFGKVYNRVATNQSLARSGSYAMERIVREVRNAQSVDGTASTFGAHPGRLTVVTPVSPGVTKTSEFSVVGGQVRLSENEIVTGTLTESDIVIESLVFSMIAATSSDAVKIDLTLSKAFATTTVMATFHGTAVLRGSYAL